jgi:L-threonylcarbamoyladenylate synthase
MERLTANAAGMARAAELLRSGAVIGFPTDTVYGLGAAAGVELALERMYEIKGRPSGQPLVLMLASAEQTGEWAVVDERSRSVIDHWWPGPLTLVLPAREHVVRPLAAGDPPTIGIRVPSHPVAQALLQAAGPLGTTSANRSGEPPALTAGGLQELEGLHAVVDGGRAPGGVASTVLDLSADEPHVLREGPIPRWRLMEWLVGADA